MSTPYGDLAGALAYHTARNNAAWLTSDDPTRTAALLVASDYIDGTYRLEFPGVKVGFRTQEREWPRNGAADRLGYTILNTEIPIEMLNATYEVALRQIVSPGSLNTDFTLNKNKKSVTVQGAVSVVYTTAMDARDAQLVMPDVELILAPILTGNDYITPPSRLGGKSTR